MILIELLALLGCGMLLITPLVPGRQVGGNVVRFLAFAGAILLVPGAATVTRDPGAAGSLATLAVGVALGAGVVIGWERRWPEPLLPAAGIAGLVAAVAMARPAAAAADPVLLLWADALSSALLLGTTCGAMILGHYYLVNTGMGVAPLCRLTLALGCSATLKGAVVAAAFLQRGWPAGGGDPLLILLLPPGLFYPVRVVVGVLGPLALVPMVWSTARMQATQSATGILYGAVVLVLIGEMTGRFLLLRTPLPF